MLDMHSHIIPGIDDGAKDQETALSMLKIAAHNGTTHIAATPHVIEGQWLPEWKNILEECTWLQQMAREEGLPITVVPGAEVAMGMNVLQLMKGPGAYCINEGRYMLVELPMTEIPAFADAGMDTAQAVLEEAARFHQEVTAPLNFPGDQQPTSWKDGVVTASQGFKDAYRMYREAGWQGIAQPVAYGGQALPKTIGAACLEMGNAANLSFALCPLLTDGAIEALPTDSDELADEVETTDVADETTEETATEQTTETVEAEVETTQAETEVVEDKPAKGKPIKKGGKKATK